MSGVRVAIAAILPGAIPTGNSNALGLGKFTTLFNSVLVVMTHGTDQSSDEGVFVFPVPLSRLLLRYLRESLS